ncbi:MAG: amidohydrolase family protein [Armatimonadota bacterium]
MRLFPVLVCIAPVVAVAQSGITVITDVTVKVGDGRTLENQSVLVADGKILAVGNILNLSGNPTKISGKGKFLYPGFIDAYSTRLQKSAPEPKQEGRPETNTTAPPYMWAGNRKGIYSDYSAASLLDFEKDSSLYENGVTTAFLAPNKGSIRGAGAIVNLLPSTAKDRIINPDGPFGMSYRGGSGEGYPSNILGVIALMRQVLADAKSTAEGVDVGSPKDNLKALTDLGPLMTGKRAGVFEVSLDREIDRSARIAAEFSFPFMIAGGRDAYKTIPTLTKSKAAVLLMVDYNDAPSVEPDKDTVAPADRTPTEFKQERFDRWKEQISAPTKLFRAGIPVAFSSGTSPGDFLKNIRVLIKNGLPVDDALKAMTINPAKIFGLDSQLGTVEVGKMANLVLMSGPMESETSKVEGLWIAGTPIVDPTKGGAK